MLSSMSSPLFDLAVCHGLRQHRVEHFSRQDERLRRLYRKELKKCQNLHSRDAFVVRPFRDILRLKV